MTSTVFPCRRCGGSMFMRQREADLAGYQSILLEWMTCMGCRDVRLDYWTFTDELVVDESTFPVKAILRPFRTP